jgi:hypothetical protein
MQEYAHSDVSAFAIITPAVVSDARDVVDLRTPIIRKVRDDDAGQQA